jgi:hypothetical protein
MIVSFFTCVIMSCAIVRNFYLLLSQVDNIAEELNHIREVAKANLTALILQVNGKLGRSSLVCITQCIV